MKKLVIPMMLALAGCATTQTSTPVVQVFERKVQIPQSLLHCKPEPKAVGSLKGQKAAAGFVIDLADAGQDCRRKLGAVGRYVESMK